MTRKDFILIAAALKAAGLEAASPHPVFSSAPAHNRLLGRDICAVRLADALARDNPRFDRERFLKAAGVQS